ncbi:penicillin-binding transpeptidase domain-containing protein, partial [Anaerofustis stercorihominis]|uniref:penicillin-binding transpeptidase domain-containing protein n=1 Tax=Anaerofustis stercorihominis TaxID=214853 RepID=UPI0039964052
KEDASCFVLNNGLTIKTTLDPVVQNALEKTAENDSIFPSQSYSASQASAAMTKKKGEKIEYKPEVGMTVIENKTGRVAGIVGGRNKTASLSLNRATQKFQPGSSTKPLTTYGPGIDSGQITAGTAFNDTSISIGGWRPKNSGGGNQGMMTVRKGLTNSTNTIAVQAMMQTGAETIVPYAEKLGLDIVKDSDTNDLNPAALALGGYTHGQTTLNMASAYTTFANGGVRQTPILYTEITDKNGDVILSNKSEKVKVFEAGTAFIITDILKDVVKGGTTYISIDGTQVAGKTGTTDENRHAWFCGYTPEYSGAVWYGYDQNVVSVNGSTYHLNIGTYGGSTNGPAAFWKNAFSDIYSKKKVSNSQFASKPDDVYQAAVDGVSGKSPTALSSKDPRGSKVYTEYFLTGKGLSGKDDIHVSASICSASKKKATKYCPKDLVKKSVLLDLSKITYPPGVTGKNEVGSQAKYSLKGKCDIHNKGTAQALTLTISPGTINVGESATVTTKITLADGSTKNVNAKISSSSSGIASVSGNSIKGVSAGNATITATYTQEGETLTAKAGITVKGAAAPTVQSYGLDSNSVTVNKGSGYSTPSATVTLSDGSTDSATVTVTGEGGFDRNTPGTYTISCSISYNGTRLGSAQFTVTVVDNSGGSDDGDNEDDKNKNSLSSKVTLSNQNTSSYSIGFRSLLSQIF